MADTGHTAGKGDQVSTPGGNGTVHAIEGEQVTGILHRNGMPFSYHHSRVAVVAKAPQQEQPASPSAGQFEGHTPGPWMAITSVGDNLRSYSQSAAVGTPDGRWLICGCFEDTPGGEGTAAANAELIAAAPSLLARAEAAEERVRVLEGALKTVATKLQQAEIVAYQGGSGSKQRVADLINDANCAARAALATTGVQHG